jgi:hypothetical protein
VDTDLYALVHSHNELSDLQELAIVTQQKITDSDSHFAFEKQLKENFTAILKMCSRHPAHAQPLIDELEQKLAQDSGLITIIQNHLREETYENVATANYYKAMYRGVRDSKDLNHSLIMNRIEQRENLDRAGSEEEGRTRTTANYRPTISSNHANHNTVTSHNGKLATTINPLSVPQTAESEAGSEESLAQGVKDMDKSLKYSKIQQRIENETGFRDLEAFAQKFLNQPNLETQLMELKRVSDLRIKKLGEELNETRRELVGVQNTALSGTSGKETKIKNNDLTVLQTTLKRSKEKSDASENLLRNLRTGLENVAGIVGIPHPHPDTSVHEIMNQIESVMEILMEEKDKTAQKTLAESHNSTTSTSVAGSGEDKARRSSVNLNAALEASNRPPELDAALNSFSQSKSKVASNLYGSKPSESEGGGGYSSSSSDTNGGNANNNVKKDALHFFEDKVQESDFLGEGSKMIKSTSAKALKAQAKRNHIKMGN